jgi:hypothetical protein
LLIFLFVNNMGHGIDVLEIATGLKDALINNGLTIESIFNFGPAGIASILGIDVYVAKIIFDATKNAVNNNDFKHNKIM